MIEPGDIVKRMRDRRNRYCGVVLVGEGRIWGFWEDTIKDAKSGLIRFQEKIKKAYCRKPMVGFDNELAFTETITGDIRFSDKPAEIVEKQFISIREDPRY